MLVSNPTLLCVTALLCLVLCLAVGCDPAAEPRSQLLVVVNSDFEPERELAKVALRVDGEERARVPITADGTPTIPFSFGVLPPGGDVNAAVTVEAEALSSDGLPLACPARAHVGFVVGEARLVTLELTRACGAGSCTCADTETCVQGECIAYDRATSELPRIEPGRELEGVEVLPSTTLPAPERHVCNTDNGSWSDVGRRLTRNYDDQLCPIMSDGTDWGSAANSLEKNRQALSDYIDRHLQVEHDLITFQVVWIAGELRVWGLFSFDIDEAKMPTLSETLQLPALQAAEQPLQLVIRGEHLARSALTNTLPRILLDAGIVRPCRPIYLTANGLAPFAALLQLRESIRTQPRWSELWNLVHFGRRVDAVTADKGLAELSEAAAQGIERVAIDAKGVALPLLRRHARVLPILTEFHNATNSRAAVVNLCDGSSGVEALLSAQRTTETRWFDELRFQLSSARTLIDLDVSGLEAGATTLSYKGFPDLTVSRDLKLEATQPALVTGLVDPQRGDSGTVLRFKAENEQSLALHDATYNVERKERRYFAWPEHTLMVTARLAVGALPVGARQVLVSKLRGESGWALQYVNEGAGSVLQYIWYGRGRETGIVAALKGSIAVSALPMQSNALFTIYLKNHGIAILDQLKPVVSAQDVNAFNQHAMITNDAPITLGADPDGGGYFSGDIQSVKISSLYEGPRDFRQPTTPP